MCVCVCVCVCGLLKFYCILTTVDNFMPNLAYIRYI